MSIEPADGDSMGHFRRRLEITGGMCGPATQSKCRSICMMLFGPALLLHHPFHRGATTSGGPQRDRQRAICTFPEYRKDAWLITGTCGQAMQPCYTSAATFWNLEIRSLTIRPMPDGRVLRTIGEEVARALHSRSSWHPQ
jgi:hypothetical protein